MIQRYACFKRGALGQLSIDDVEEYLRYRVRDAIIDFNKDASGVVPDCYYGWLNINLFDREEIALNDKNIELKEKIYLVKNAGNDAKLNNALKNYRIEDVGIEIFIYRVGSYSYYAAVCQAYSPDHPTE